MISRLADYYVSKRFDDYDDDDDTGSLTWR